MKTFVLAMIALIGFQQSALASSAGVTLTAQNASQVVQITDQQFEPIYGQEPYDSTCSRQVYDHTETSCETVNDSVCHGGGESCETVNDSVCNSSGCTTVPRRVCSNEPETCESVPRRSCSDHEVDRTEYYACTLYRTVVVGQQLVKTFNHSIEVDVANPAILGGVSLAIDVDASQASVSAALENSFAAGILTYQVVSVSQNDSGAVRNSSEKIIIDMAMSSGAAKAIDTAVIDSLALGHNALSFNLRNAASIMGNLNVAIKLVRNRALFGDTTLYDSKVASSTLGLVAQGSDIRAMIPFQKLGIGSINNLRFDLAVSITLNPGAGAILNPRDFNAELSKRLDSSLTKVKASF